MRNAAKGFLLLFAFFYLFCCAPSKKEKTHKLIISAREKMYEGEFMEALKDLEKCEKLYKNNPEIYLLRGNIYTTYRKYAEAIEFYNYAIELNENYMEAYIARGLAKFYITNNPYDKCEDFLKAESLGAKNLREDTKFCR